MKNLNILKSLLNSVVELNELIELGFDDTKIIKSDSRAANPLLGSVTYHNKTFYEGIELEIDFYNNAKVKELDITSKDAELLNRFRDETIKLRALEAQIYTYKVEFNDIETAKALEERLPKQKAKVKAIELRFKLMDKLKNLNI